MANNSGALVTIKLTEAEKKRFMTIIDQMVQKQHSTFEKVTRNLARDTARIAINKTQIAPKFGSHVLKSEIHNQDMAIKFYKRLGKQGGNSSPYMVRMINKKTGKMVFFAATSQEANEYVGKGASFITPKRGFAKSGWLGALYKLLGGQGKFKYMDSDKWGKMSKSNSGSSFNITLTNEVPFISEWDKGRNRWHTPQQTVENSIRAAVLKWERILNKYVNHDRIVKGAFREMDRADAELERASQDNIRND